MPEVLPLSFAQRVAVCRRELGLALGRRRLRSLVRAPLSVVAPGRWPQGRPAVLDVLEAAARGGDAAAAASLERLVATEADVEVPGRRAALRRAVALEALAGTRDEVTAHADRAAAAYLRGDLGPRSAPRAPERVPGAVAADAIRALRAAGHERPLVVPTFPGWNLNPYAALMERAFPAAGIAAVHVDTPDGVDDVLAAVARDGARALVQLNAPDRFVGGARTHLEAEVAAADALAHVDRWIAAGARLAWSVHNGPRLAGYRSVAERLVAQGIADRADVVHVLAADTASLLAGWVRLDPGRTVHVGHPSYDGIYGPMPDRAAARASLGIPGAEGLVVVGLVGTLADRKGAQLLLDALDLVPDPLPDGRRLHLVLAGMLTAPRNEALVRRIVTHPRVTARLGYVPDASMPALLGALDVAAIPYHQMLNSGWLHLALTVGLPVIASADGTAPGIVRPDALRTFAPGDATSLASVLARAGELLGDDARGAARASVEDASADEHSAAFAAALLRAADGGRPSHRQPGAVDEGLAPATIAEARRLVARDPADAPSPDPVVRAAELQRGQAAELEGRYRDALRHAHRADLRGRGPAAHLAGRAEARLAVLRPGWTPDLGSEALALGRVRPPFVAGRVLHLVGASLPYRQAGYTVRTQAIATAQRGAGLDPHVATRAGFPGADADGPVPPSLEVDGIPHHFPGAEIRGTGRVDDALWSSARALVPLLDELRPAVLQPSSNHELAQIALPLGRVLGIPVVYEVRGFWEETWVAGSGLDESVALASDRYRGTREAETAAMLAADAVVTLSEAMADEIRGRGVPADRVVVTPNGVDADRFVPAPRDVALARSAGIEDGDLVVGYVTSVTAYEGIGVLLEAAAALRRSHRVKVLVVGDGPDLEHVRATGAALGLDDGTMLLPGRVPHADVARWYGLIDVFVVPRLDTRVTRIVTPLKPYEAMALEIPVVVSDLPALREMVIEGETGSTFRPGDPASLAAALGTLLDDAALRRRMGANAREWVRANRSWAANGARYRALFERLGAV